MLLELGQKLVQPVCAMVVSCLSSNLCKIAGIMAAGIIDGLLHLVPQISIRNDDVGRFQPSDVEGFPRGGKGDASSCLGRRGQIRLEPISRMNQIGMELIRDDQNIMLGGSLGHLGQFVTGPYTTGGIMRIGDYHRTGLVKQVFKRIEIEPVFSLAVNFQHPRKNLASCGLDRRWSGRICRIGNDYRAGGRQSLPEYSRQGFHHSSYRHQTGRTDLPAVAPFEPVTH